MVSKVVIVSIGSIISLIVCSVSIAVLLFVLKSSSSLKSYYIPIKNYIYNWINYAFSWLSLVSKPQEFLGVKTKLKPCDPKYDDDGITCWSKPGYIQQIRNPPLKKGCNEFDGRFRDDGTSCWLDTYGNGVGTVQEYGPCPPRSTANAIGDCVADRANRQDNRNDAEPWGKSWDKSDGCSWNRHIEGGMCFRDCPEGFFGRAHEGCWANGADSFGVMKRALARLRCPDGKVNIAGLCYNNCKEGYEFVGGNLCQPKGGPGIKKTLFDRQYCPPGQHMDAIHAFCYDDCKPGWRSDGALACVKNENSGNTIIPEIKVDMFSRSTCSDNEKYKLGPGNLLCYPKFPTMPVYNKNDTVEVPLKTS